MALSQEELGIGKMPFESYARKGVFAGNLDYRRREF